MNTVSADPVELTDLHPSRDDLLGDVLAGLSGAPKRLPSKYFYDRRGSELFEEITRQPEYYLTRVELALLEAERGNIASVVGPHAHVVEYGSGSGRKTRILIDAIEPVEAFGEARYVLGYWVEDGYGYGGMERNDGFIAVVESSEMLRQMDVSLKML